MSLEEEEETGRIDKLSSTWKVSAYVEVEYDLQEKSTSPITLRYLFETSQRRKGLDVDRNRIKKFTQKLASRIDAIRVRPVKKKEPCNNTFYVQRKSNLILVVSTTSTV